MRSKNVKLVGLLFLIVALTLTMAACDTANKVSNNTDKTGSLAIKAEANLESETMEAVAVKSGEVGIQSIPEERFKNYKIEVTIENEAGETVTKKSNYFDTLNETKAVKFTDLYVGKWTIKDVILTGTYNYDGYEEEDVEIGSNSSEPSVTVTSDRVNSVDITVDKQNTGNIKVSIHELPQDKSVDIKINNKEEVTYSSTNGEHTWENLEAKMATMKINSEAIDGEQQRKVMVVPGLTKELTVHLSEGDAEVNVDFALVP